MIRDDSQLTLESFAMHMEEIHDVELAKLHALSMSVGWPHREADWEMLLGFGQGFAACDEIGRVLGTAMWFAYGGDFATVGMTITSPRLQTQGAGRWLMQRVIERTRPRHLGLNATRAARPLYRSLGFAAEQTVFQCQGEVRLASPSEPTLQARPALPADRDAILGLDRQAFGADRASLLHLLFGQGDGLVLERGGAVVGYSLRRPFGRGHVVGPLVAAGDEDAIALTLPHLRATAGGFVRLDTREATGHFAEFLVRSGLAVFDTVTTMSLGRPFVGPGREPDGRPRTYGLASHALS